jgi:hypothetical protein
MVATGSKVLSSRHDKPDERIAAIGTAELKHKRQIVADCPPFGIENVTQGQGYTTVNNWIASEQMVSPFLRAAEGPHRE